jgi:pimeloyl-ACP methyl ester carboxylesterase
LANTSDGALRRAYIDSRYGQLHYRIVLPRQAPTAPPLVCLHQTPSSGRDWEPVLTELAADRVVVAPDTPGYGMSDPPPTPLEIVDFAAIMLRFMDDLAAATVVPRGPFDIMGMHTGSVTATEMARAYPARVRKLVLFGLAAYDADLRAQKLAKLAENFPPPGSDLAHVEKLWSVISRLSDPRKTAEDRHVGMAECLRLGSRMPWGYIAVYRYDFLAAMPQVRQPVLVINPEDDLWAVTRATSHLLPNGRRFDMPGVAHGVLTIEKTRVVGAIQEFIA